MDFSWLYEPQDHGGVRSIITQDNVRECDSNGCGVVWHMCRSPFFPDDAKTLTYFIKLGASYFINVQDAACRVIVEPIHLAARTGKKNMLRVLLDLGIPVDTPSFCVRNTPLFYAVNSDRGRDCARLLLDAGANLDLVHNNIKIPTWVGKFVANRYSARNASIAILYLHSDAKATKSLCGNGRDMLRMIARCVWSTRGHN